MFPDSFLRVCRTSSLGFRGGGPFGFCLSLCLCEDYDERVIPSIANEARARHFSSLGDWFLLREFKTVFHAKEETGALYSYYGDFI